MITYKSNKYDPKKKYKRFVRCDSSGTFFFCEVEDGYDVAQGVAYENEINPEVVNAAKERMGYFPSYVDWPY
jgi:hypothetical protein